MTVAIQETPAVVLPSFSVLGKKAFVTGGSRGIGRACALTLAAAGADVAVGSSPAGVERPRACAARSASSGGAPRPTPFDVATRGAVEDDVRARDQRLRGDRHPGQQRRRHARRPLPQDGPRRVGRGHQHEPQQRVRGHPALHRRDGGARVGARHQHLQHRRPHRQLRPGELRRRQGRPHRVHEDAGARIRAQGRHRQRHRARLRPDAHARRRARQGAAVGARHDARGAARRSDGDRRPASSTSPRRRRASSPGTSSTSTAAWRCSGGSEAGEDEQEGVVATVESRTGGRRSARSVGDDRRREERRPTRPAAALRRTAADVAPPAEPPRASCGGARDARRHDAGRGRAERGDAQAPPLPARDAGHVRRAGAALLRARQPRLHPRPAAGQERRPAVPEAGLRRLPDRLGRPVRRRPRADARALRVRVSCRAPRLHPRAPSAASGCTCSATAWAARWRRCFAALRPELLQTLTLLAAPIDFAGEGDAAQALDRPRDTSTSTRSSTPTATARPGSCRPASCP